jgi:hypothetical protein
MPIRPLSPHQLAMPFEHGFRLKVPNHVAQLFDRLANGLFQLESQQGEGELLGSRNAQRFLQPTLDNRELSVQEQDLQILGELGLVT